eukprot:g1486.t1
MPPQRRNRTCFRKKEYMMILSHLTGIDLSEGLREFDGITNYQMYGLIIGICGKGLNKREALQEVRAVTSQWRQNRRERRNPKPTRTNEQRMSRWTAEEFGR